jgi:hypothetical protein
MTITVSATEITFNDNTTQSTAFATSYNNIDFQTSSGTYTIPSGVTKIALFVIGGGGGGGAGNSGGSFDLPTDIRGGFGGLGGCAFKTLTVTPSSNISITIGAGGSGNNNTNGSSGSNTTAVYSGVTYTGSRGIGGSTGLVNEAGVDGADGTGTNGDINGTALLFSLSNSLLPLIGPYDPTTLSTIFTQASKRAIRVPAASSTAAVAFSTGGTVLPGAKGSGETGISTNNATGGIGGAVIILY